MLRTDVYARAWLAASWLLVLTACPGDGPATPDAGVDAAADLAPADLGPDPGGAPDLPGDPGPADPGPPDPGAPDPGLDPGVDPGAPDPGADPGSADAGVDPGPADVPPDADPPVCGDGEIEGDEACDDGEANSDETPNACRTTCELPSCGDGVPADGEACDDGNANELDGCTSACEVASVTPAPGAGEVVVTEFMANPAAVGDPWGEWIELTSVADGERNLAGCVLRDDGTDLVPLGGPEVPLVLGPGERLVLGFSDDPAVNGGAAVDVAYETMLLDNFVDEIRLECGDVLVDGVAYTHVTFPMTHGRAVSLDPPATDAADNDAAISWCSSDTIFGDGDFGTPGQPNPACPPPDTTVDVCALMADEALVGFVDVALPLVVHIAEPELTDVSDGVDAYPDLVVEVGLGPAGADPATDGAWVWSETHGVAGWSDEGGVDAWAGAVTPTGEGAWTAAARASRDGGVTWVLCDRDADTPWDLAEAASVAVVADPCAAAPCTAPPADDCDDDQVTILAYPSDGACTPVADGVYDCTYEPLPLSCADQGLLCDAGACGPPVPAPDAGGQLAFVEVLVTPAVADYLGEWFEVLNTTDGPLELAGCEIRDGGVDVHLIAGPLVLASGARAVFARSGNPVVNGGVAVDVVVGEDVLLDPVDELELRCGGAVIDAVGWTTAWPHAKGVAMALSPFAPAPASDNDAPTRWCKAEAPFGAGGLGTPGDANTPCPGDVEPLDACRVLGDAERTVAAGVTTWAEAIVVEAGITDASSGADAAPALRVEVGTGPVGSLPDGSWTWSPAAPDATWDATAEGAPKGEDRWVASWRPPAPGTWSLAFRASADGGNSWTLCDRDDSDGAYEPTQAVTVISTPSACSPDPCGPEPGSVCADDTVVVPGGWSECSIDTESGGALCAWPGEVVEDCGVQGASCADGACVGYPAAPGAGDLLLSELLIVPSTGPSGEWIELYNPTDTVWSLEGCALTSAPDEVWLFDATAADPLVWPGQAVVLARSDDPADTEGAPVDAVYTGLALDNVEDTVTLACGGATVTSLAWSPPAAPPAGRTVSLSRGWALSGVGDDLAHFCSSPPGSTPAGTPGELNAVCPPADAVVDDCRHAGPLDVAIDAGVLLELSGLLFDAGTTNAWVGVDLAPGMQAQVGIGAPGTDPAAGGWTWVPATADAGWDDAAEPGWDRWLATVTLTEPGTWATAWRFSVDDGASWTTCDADGAANGYDPARAGEVVASATLCLPNPCLAPPDPFCKGDAIVVSAGPGACSEADDGSAACQYARTFFDCGPWGGCAQADCVGLGSPKLPGDVVITALLADSADGGVDDGEWIELTNPTTDAFDLRGCALSDDGGQLWSFGGDLPALIAPDGRVVVAANDDAATNGGLEAIDHVWSGLSLGNVVGGVTLTCGGGVIDAVAWGADWAIAPGQALQLSPDAVDATANDDPASWCAATVPYGDGSNTGTPGEANAACP